MAWNWKTALRVGEDCGADPAGEGATRKVPPQRGEGGDESPRGGRRLAGMVWRPGDGGGGALAPQPAHDPLYADVRPCVFCGGRGALPGRGLCPVCNGRGSVHVAAPAATCAFCRGRGKMPPNSHLTCWVCKGKGVVSVVLPIVTCGDCRGRGRRPCESLPCARCGGVGVLSASADPATGRT